MQTITLAEAQARLPELIDSLETEEEIVITRGDQAIAVIRSKAAEPSAPASMGKRLAATQEVSSAPGFMGLKAFSVGKVLKPEFIREEVWDEMSSRSE